MALCLSSELMRTTCPERLFAVSKGRRRRTRSSKRNTYRKFRLPSLRLGGAAMEGLA